MQGFLEHAGWLDDAQTIPFLETLNQRKILLGLTDQSAEIDPRRIARKPDAAALAPRGLQIAELGEAEHYFHQVIPIDPMAFGNFVDCCKFLALDGNEYQGAKAIIRKVGEAHRAESAAYERTVILS